MKTIVFDARPIAIGPMSNSRRFRRPSATICRNGCLLDGTRSIMIKSGFRSPKLTSV